MELPNQYFQDFPIEFKEINPSDFPYFDVKNKIIIEPWMDILMNLCRSKYPKKKEIQWL